MKISARSYGLLLWTALAAACGGEDAPKDEGSAATDSGTNQDASAGDAGADAGDAGAVEAEESWTFFVYGHGDHNLSHSLLRDIAEMATADIGDNVNVVVLADYDSSQVLSTSGQHFPDGSEWLHIAGGGADPEVFDTAPEQNLDDPAVLSAAIAKAFTAYPAMHYAVVLWDHGGSWQHGFGSDTQNGTVAQPKPMLPAVVAGAVKSGLAQAGLKQPLDIFSFDACLMAGAEVSWEFLELAKVYIGNAEIDYGDGWDYDAFLTYLSAHSSATAQTIGAEEAKFWDAHHRSASANDTILRSHVALDTALLSDFGDAYAAFVEAWTTAMDVAGGSTARAAYFTLPPYLNELSGPNNAPELRDLGQFLSLIAASDDGAVTTAAKTALDALKTAILGRSQGDLRGMAGQVGVHFELPLASQFSAETLAAYRKDAVVWNGQSGWDDALQSYAEADDRAPPVLATTHIVDKLGDGTPAHFITFAPSDSDVAEVAAYLAQVAPASPNTLRMLGIIAKGAVLPVAANEDPYAIDWEGQVTTLSDSSGALQAVAPYVWEDLGSSIDGTVNIAPLLAIRGAFGPNPEDPQEIYEGVLLYQDGEETVKTLSLLDPPVTFSLTEIASDYPGSTFTPLYELLVLDTGMSDVAFGEPLALDAASLPLGIGEAADGNYAIRTELTDVFGNASSSVDRVVLPIPVTQ